MSYEAMYKIRASGLVDRTQVDVLEALAFFQNSDSGACFPSTEAIARVSRVNDRLVRTTLKKTSRSWIRFVGAAVRSTPLLHASPGSPSGTRERNYPPE